MNAKAQRESRSGTVAANVVPLSFGWRDSVFTERDCDPDPSIKVPPMPERIELDNGRKRIPVSVFLQFFLTSEEALRLELYAMGVDENGNLVEKAAQDVALLARGYWRLDPYINLDRPEHRDLIKDLAHQGVLHGPWRAGQVIRAEIPTETDPAKGGQKQ